MNTVDIKHFKRYNNANNSNEMALTYSLDYRNLIAKEKEFMGLACSHKLWS